MRLVILLAICIILITGCSDNSGGSDMYMRRLISASEAKEKIDNYPDAIILDVRNRNEFLSGHIPGAILLPEFEIAENAEIVLPDMDALILVYCRSGVRSRNAVVLLVSLGYTNVYDFGGILNWPYEIVVP